MTRCHRVTAWVVLLSDRRSLPLLFPLLSTPAAASSALPWAAAPGGINQGTETVQFLALELLRGHLSIIKSHDSGINNRLVRILSQAFLPLGIKIKSVD